MLSFSFVESTFIVLLSSHQILETESTPKGCQFQSASCFSQTFLEYPRNNQHICKLLRSASQQPLFFFCYPHNLLQLMNVQSKCKLCMFRMLSFSFVESTFIVLLSSHQILETQSTRKVVSFRVRVASPKFFWNIHDIISTCATVTFNIRATLFFFYPHICN